jgi:hypothetical protein
MLTKTEGTAAIAVLNDVVDAHDINGVMACSNAAMAPRRCR